MFRRKKAWRSPLKAAPHRNPGQSLDEQISDLIFDGLAFWILNIAFWIALVMLEWLRWFNQTPPQPVLTTVLVIPLIGYAVFKILGVRSKIKTLTLARDGEKAVGQFLEDFRNEGCKVFHDIVGEGFNIDHLLISPQGVFTVETKTFSKPPRGKPTIYFDGNILTIKGKNLDRDPVVQAKAQSRWIREMLQEVTGKVWPVKSVIVFPGWYVEARSGANRGNLWVLNPKALPSFLKNSPVCLSSDEVRLLSSQISKYLRTPTK